MIRKLLRYKGLCVEDGPPRQTVLRDVADQIINTECDIKTEFCIHSVIQLN